MNQIEILQWFTQLQHPFWDQFARVFTFLGNEEFYFLILPFVYWCISKTVGFRLFYMFIFSMTVNSFLKIYFAVIRPIGTQGIHSIFIESAQVGSHYPYDSFPSGHAQGSTTLWGYIAYKSKSPMIIAFCMIPLFLTSLSRLYSGLHWPTDVLAGIAIGILIIIVAVFADNFVSSLGIGVKWILACIVPIALVVLFPETEGFKFAGLLLGAGIGYLLEGSFVKMEISSSIFRKGIAFLVGIAGMFVIQVGLKELFPSTQIFDFTRYGLIGLWGLFVAPYLFVAFKIYEKKQPRHFPMFSHRM